MQSSCKHLVMETFRKESSHLTSELLWEFSSSDAMNQRITFIQPTSSWIISHEYFADFSFFLFYLGSRLKFICKSRQFIAIAEVRIASCYSRFSLFSSDEFILFQGAFVNDDFPSTLNHFKQDESFSRLLFSYSMTSMKKVKQTGAKTNGFEPNSPFSFLFVVFRTTKVAGVRKNEEKQL